MFVTPKFCISIVFSFCWGHFNSQEKRKTMLMQNFGVTNTEHYGMLWYCNADTHEGFCSRSMLQGHTPGACSRGTLREHAPGAHSGSMLQGHTPGACSRGTLREHAPGAHSGSKVPPYVPTISWVHFILGSRISTPQNVPRYLTD